jgi:hypothetical protein
MPCGMLLLTPALQVEIDRDTFDGLPTAYASMEGVSLITDRGLIVTARGRPGSEAYVQQLYVSPALAALFSQNTGPLRGW